MTHPFDWTILRNALGGSPIATETRAWLTALCATTRKRGDVEEPEEGEEELEERQEERRGDGDGARFSKSSRQASAALSQSSLTGAFPSISNSSGLLFHLA